MIILPTEKRIDWKNPPYVLFALIVLNILVFAFYQSSDYKSYINAEEEYRHQDFIEFEAPAYISFLKTNGFEDEHPAEFIDIEAAFEKDPSSITQDILLDRTFYDYMLDNETRYIPADKRQQWRESRPQINAEMQSISSFAAGLTPQELAPVTLVSHVFLHGDLMHLIGNMVFLLICGFAVEAALGHGRFLAFYLISGIAGGLTYSLIENLLGRGDMPLVGASGAISGVMAMYLMLFRLKKIEFFYWVFFLVGYFRAPALIILPLYIGNEIFSYLTENNSNVAFMAHTGGFVSGAILVAITLWRKPQIINQAYIEEDQNADPDREALAQVYQFIDDYQFDSALRTLDRLIESSGETDDRIMLQYHLTRIQGGQAWIDCGLKLLTNTDTSSIVVKNQLKAWLKAEPPIKNALPPEEKIRLATRFLSIEAVEPADEIANSLLENEHDSPLFTNLIGKLADIFKKRQHSAKANLYQKIWQARSGDSSEGVTS